MRKSMPFIILLFILSLAVPNTVYSQISLDVPRITPISPTATALEKYQSYPVNHCTGIPDITIPLYEIVAKDVTIPVTLTYHASGLKPKERSGFAGTGWTLNLEPSVTRQVLGISDDSTLGWTGNPQKDKPISDNSNSEMIQYYNQFIDNIRDVQPDKYTYKLAQRGGSGYFTSARTFNSLPRNNDRVVRNMGKVTITDPKGIIYNFGDVCEKSGTTVTRWMCSTIQSPNYKDGPLVSFFYDGRSRCLNPSQFYQLEKQVVVDHSIPNLESVVALKDSDSYYLFSPKGNSPGEDGIYEGKLETSNPEQAGVSYGGNNPFVQEYLNIAWLEKVTFLGNEITISYNEIGGSLRHNMVLDAMEVRDQNRNLIRKISFYISFYNEKTSLTKLDSVVISAPEAEDRIYTFSYNNSWYVPTIYTTAVDHWGFCNGEDRSRNLGTVPSFNQIISYMSSGTGQEKPIRLQYNGANREPAHNWTQVGMLKNITNPTGAVTTFFYEGNYGAFNDDQSEEPIYLHPVGGVRIRKIVAKDLQTGTSLTKSYRYGLGKKDDHSSQQIWGGGAIKHIVTARDYHRPIIHRVYDGLFSVNHHLDIYGSLPNSNITFNGGSAVMYSMVEELIQDEGERTYSKNRYYYHVKTHEYNNVLRWGDIQPNIYSIIALIDSESNDIKNRIARKSPYHPQEPSDDFIRTTDSNQMYGALLREEQIGQNRFGAIEEVKLRKDYTYQEIYASGGIFKIDMPIRKVMGYFGGMGYLDVFYLCDRNYDWEYPTCYSLDNQTFRGIDKEITKEYYYTLDKVDSVVTERKYTYNTLGSNYLISLEPKQIDTKNSDNSVVVDEFKYLYSYPAILSEHKHSEAGSFTESRILFKTNKNLPEKVQSRTSGMSDFLDHLTYDEYDTNGNVLQLTGKDGMPISFIWAYKGQYPIAEIRNATYAQVKSALNDPNGAFLASLASKSAPLVSDMSRINDLRNNSMLQNTHVSTFTYRPLFGILSETNPQGETIYYDYDSFGRLIRTYQIKAGKEETIEEYHYHYRGGN